MNLIHNFPFFSIILAMACGIVSSILSGKNAKRLTLVMLTAVAVMSAFLLGDLLQNGESYTFMMGHYPAPWGNEIRAGVLEALMALCFSVVMIFSLLGGMKHIFHDVEEAKLNLYFIMMDLLMSSLLALIYTNDLFTAYVFIEINTISACAIVMIKNTGRTIVAATRYLIMSLLGSGLFLIGITLIYDLTGHLLMSNIKESMASLHASGAYILPITVTIGLISTGMAIKSALFPFHSWLPDAHGSAVTSSSAILSGLVLKGYIILLIKIFYRVFGLDVILSDKVPNVLFVFGIAGIIFGSLNALKERDIKRMLAYSSVAQIGYIFMGIGYGNNEGMIAACIHILVHAVTKSMLFCAAGGLMEVSENSRDFSKLKGAGYRNKMAGAAFVVGALSMIGIPFFAGFISKLYFATGAFSRPHKMWFVLFALAVSTVLNALYYVPVIINLYTKNDEVSVEKSWKPNFSFVVAMVVFIALNFVIGLGSSSLVEAIRTGINTFG